jgi:hypothetical protein
MSSHETWKDCTPVYKIISLNPVHAKVYSIQHYVIKFVSDMLVVTPGTPVSSTNKTDHHDITETLLNVVLNTYDQYLCIYATLNIWW